MEQIRIVQPALITVMDQDHCSAMCKYIAAIRMAGYTMYTCGLRRHVGAGVDEVVADGRDQYRRTQWCRNSPVAQDDQPSAEILAAALRKVGDCAVAALEREEDDEVQGLLHIIVATVSATGIRGVDDEEAT